MDFLREQIEEACYNGDFKSLRDLCQSSDEDAKFLYLDEICSPYISRGHLMCANYIISCEKTDFIKNKYIVSYEHHRNWALRDYIIKFKVANRFFRIIKIFRKKKARVARFLKLGY
jgi:hypothetical protein